MGTQSIVATAIKEIVGDMTDQAFADALGAFTGGELHPARGTVQKWRTGQREPMYDDFNKILAYGSEFKRLSEETSERLADFFHLAKMVQEKASTEMQAIAEHIDNRIKRELNLVHDSQHPTFIPIPILGKVPAGLPINVPEYTEGYMAMPNTMLKGEDYFFLKVTGHSMKDVDINDGDLVLVRKSDVAENGQTVVARVNGQDVTVKKFFKAADMVTLVPANKDFEPINAIDIKIVGIVERVMKNWEG